METGVLVFDKNLLYNQNEYRFQIRLDKKGKYDWCFINRKQNSYESENRSFKLQMQGIFVPVAFYFSEEEFL